MALVEFDKRDAHGNTIGVKDRIPVALRDPVAEGERVTTYDQVLENLTKPDGMSEHAWAIRKGVVESLGDFAGDNG